MLKTRTQPFYIVKEGQNLRSIAEYFSVSERLLVKTNALAAPPLAGMILRIPDERGNAYTVREGDTMELLCGSKENFERKNGGDIFYIGMRARI